MFKFRMLSRTRFSQVLTISAFLMGLMVFSGIVEAQIRKKPIFQKKPNARKQGPTAKKLAQIGGFSNWVTDVAFSPDGKQLAAGSQGQLKFIDVSRRRVLETVKTAPGYIRALAYSPDGKWLAVGGYQVLQLWDPTTRKPVRELGKDGGHTGQITGAMFSADGKRLATSSNDETVRIWDVSSGKELLKITDFEYPVNGVAFSPDGKWIATASGDEYRVTRPGIVRVWDSKTGAEKSWKVKSKDGTESTQKLVEHLRAATNVIFSPNSQVLISTGYDEKVNTYNLATGKAFGFYDGHGRPTLDVVITADGKTVISVGGGRSKGKNDGKIWNRADGDELATLSGHKGPVTSVALSTDGKTVATGSRDKSVILWDISPVVPPAKVGTANSPSPVKAPKPGQPTSSSSTGSETPQGAVQSVAFLDKSRNVRQKRLRVGIIGLDTSHVLAFTKILNDPNAPNDVSNCRVVVAYPKGSPDIQSSTSRVPGYTKKVRAMGVEIVDSIPELISRVDVVLLETNDGRPHLEQVLPVLKAGKPVFIDKPIAGSLADAIAIFEAARKYKTPVFSSSSLRYMPGALQIRAGKIGDVKSALAWSPAHLEKTHPDLFWYGIHGVEALFTMMGTGCVSVTRTVHNADRDVVVGNWSGGRTGTFEGYRKGGKRGYGGYAEGTLGKMDAGKYAGYRPLLVDIVRFFRTGKSPVSERETLEIYAFMEAADESKRQGGKKVTLQSVIAKARKEAKQRLEKLDR